MGCGGWPWTFIGVNSNRSSDSRRKLKGGTLIRQRPTRQLSRGNRRVLGHLLELSPLPAQSRRTARHPTQEHANKILMGNAGNIERLEVLKAGLQDAKMMRVMLALASRLAVMSVLQGGSEFKRVMVLRPLLERLQGCTLARSAATLSRQGEEHATTAATNVQIKTTSG